MLPEDIPVLNAVGLQGDKVRLSGEEFIEDNT